MYFEVFSEIRFRKHPSQSSLYFNGAEYFYRPITCFYACVCVLYVLYDSWVYTDLSLSIKTTTATTTTTTTVSQAFHFWIQANFDFSSADIRHPIFVSTAPVDILAHTVLGHQHAQCWMKSLLFTFDFIWLSIIPCIAFMHRMTSFKMTDEISRNLPALRVPGYR